MHATLDIRFDILWQIQGLYWFLAFLLRLHYIYGARREKTCLRGVANNKGADQPAHPRSPISTFVIRFLKSTICKLALGEISIF